MHTHNMQVGNALYFVDTLGGSPLPGERANVTRYGAYAFGLDLSNPLRYAHC